MVGSGFDPENSTVTVCGAECKVDRETSTLSRLYCWSPFNNGRFCFFPTVVHCIKRRGDSSINEVLGVKNVLLLVRDILGFRLIITKPVLSNLNFKRCNRDRFVSTGNAAAFY